jgi:hypothetical protein
MADLTKKHKTKLPWQHGGFRYCGTTFIGYCVKRSIASTVCKNLSKLAYQKGLKEKEQYAKSKVLEELEDLKKCFECVNADCYDLEQDIKFRILKLKEVKQP